MRQQGVAAFYRAAHAIGLAAAKRRVTDAGLILCLHNVVADEEVQRDPLGLHMARSRFERRMRWLADHYEVIALAEFVGRLRRGQDLRTTAAVTFDDGYQGVYEYARPVLTRLGIPSTVFIVAEAAERGDAFSWDRDPSGGGLPRALCPASWETIRSAMADRMGVGAHSVTHRSLPQLTAAALARELHDSRRRIQMYAGVRPDFFAYPFGDWTAEVRAAARDAGYTAALTADAGLNDAMTDLWSLKRMNVPSGISDNAFEAWAAGLRLSGG